MHSAFSRTARAASLTGAACNFKSEASATFGALGCGETLKRLEATKSTKVERHQHCIGSAVAPTQSKKNIREEREVLLRHSWEYLMPQRAHKFNKYSNLLLMTT